MSRCMLIKLHFLYQNSKVSSTIQKKSHKGSYLKFVVDIPKLRRKNLSSKSPPDSSVSPQTLLSLALSRPYHLRHSGILYTDLHRFKYISSSDTLQTPRWFLAPSPMALHTGKTTPMPYMVAKDCPTSLEHSR